MEEGALSRQSFSPIFLKLTNSLDWWECKCKCRGTLFALLPTFIKHCVNRAASQNEKPKGEKKKEIGMAIANTSCTKTNFSNMVHDAK